MKSDAVLTRELSQPEAVQSAIAAAEVEKAKAEAKKAKAGADKAEAEADKARAEAELAKGAAPNSPQPASDFSKAEAEKARAEAAAEKTAKPTTSSIAADFGNADIPKMHAEYEANQARFMRNYKGKTLQAYLPLQSVNENLIIRARYAIQLGQGSFGGDVSCSINDQPTINFIHGITYRVINIEIRP